jgi:hypothetical protein
LVRQMLARKKTCVCYTSMSTSFVQSFHCSESAMCAVLFRETSIYGEVVTRRHDVTAHKPHILSRTFVTASNLSSKRVVFNEMQHAFTKFTFTERFICRIVSSETSSVLDIQWISLGDSVAQNPQWVSSV